MKLCSQKKHTRIIMRNIMNDHIVNILIVEDNKDNIQYLNKVISIDNQLNVQHIAQDSDEALIYLRCEGKYVGARKPELILLDADISKHRGLDILYSIKESPELRKIPVVVLTSDKQDEDKVKSYKDTIQYIIRKPIEYSKLKDIFKEFSLYWELAASEPHLAVQVD